MKDAVRITIAKSTDANRRELARLGYQPMMRGVRALLPDPRTLAGMKERDIQRVQYIWKVQAAMSNYEDKGAVLYGSSGFHVLGVDLPYALQDWEHVHILVPDGKRRPTRNGVISHHSRRETKAWGRVAGLPIPNPAQLWLQLPGATDDQMIEVGDGLLRRQRPVFKDLDAMKQSLSECAGLHGIKQARRVFPLLVPGTDSLPETSTRLKLIRGGLPCPEVNPPIITSAGPNYFIDMAYKAERIGVEYDGEYHGTEAQVRQDALRRRLLQDDGWLLVTVTKDDLKKPEQIVRSVETALLMRRGANLRAPPFRE